MTTKTAYAFDLDKLPRELARTEVIVEQRNQVDRWAPLRSVAQALSRRGLAAAKVELTNHALALAVDLVLDADEDGHRPNLDADGRVLVPLPWTRSGAKAWGLRRTEGRTFNRIMRQRSDSQPAPLFIYDAESRGWLWGSWKRATAGAYLRSVPITLSEWRAAWELETSPWARQNMAGKMGIE